MMYTQYDKYPSFVLKFTSFHSYKIQIAQVKSTFGKIFKSGIFCNTHAYIFGV